MSGVGEIFKPGHKALIAYLTVGHPDKDATVRAAKLLASAGCDLIELGIPFSDPLADGATIQRASHRALLNGVTPGVCLDIARQLTCQINIPLVFMTYLNPLLSYGCAEFTRDCRASGVGGLIIPDLPPDEGGEVEQAALKEGLDMIYLLAPNSSPERVRLVSDRSRGFIYLVSLTGTTGVRSFVSKELDGFVQRVRAVTRTPLCVGFGISTPEQAVQAASSSDGVIIGSRIMQLLEDDPSLAALGQFIREIRGALIPT